MTVCWCGSSINEQDQHGAVPNHQTPNLGDNNTNLQINSSSQEQTSQPQIIDSQMQPQKCKIKACREQKQISKLKKMPVRSFRNRQGCNNCLQQFQQNMKNRDKSASEIYHDQCTCFSDNNSKSKALCKYTLYKNQWKYCSDHNSTSEHLCKCKLCRDKIGELFNHIQKYLLLVHFTRKEIGLMCGCVTCNNGCLQLIKKCSFKQTSDTRIFNGNEPCSHLDLEYGSRTKCLIVRSVGANNGSAKPFAQIYFAIFLAILFVVRFTYTCAAALRALSTQVTDKKTSQRKFNIYLLSSVLILASSRLTELPQMTKRKRENLLGDDKLSEIFLYLQKRKSKTSKMILHDIIDHISLRRNDVFALYPVSRRGKEEMASELLRLGSFHNYPRENGPSLIFLAKSGFYYEGKGREVVCFSCGITHDDWSYNSKPNEVHYRISPECPYLKEYFPVVQTLPSECSCDQIPFTAKNQALSYMNIEADSIQPCTDAAGNLPPTLLVSSSADPRVVKNSFESGYIGSSYISSQNISGRSQHSTLLTSTSKDSGYGSSVGSNSSSYGIGLQNGSETDRSFQTFEGNTQVQTQSTANTPKEKYPEYKLIERRRNTYKNWPSNLSFLHPLDLSECGFFYSNFGDCVRCFHCGIGLRNWEADDNPWVEHARWSRKCPYLLQRKGQGFIDSVLTVLGLQTDAEIDQQTNNAGSEQSSQASSGYGTVSNDVRNPIQHPSAQYVLTEKIFGENKDRLVKMTMNQLLQAHDWNDITNDMLVNAVLEHKDGTEFMETRNNPADLSESKSQSSANLVSENQKSKQLLSPAVANVTESSDSDIDNSEKILKENEELKDLYTCKICLDERVGITFVPCGHLVTCKNCSPKIRRCPLCREFIRGTIKTTL